MSISAETSARISASLQGKIGEQSRGWKGEGAGYYAKHMWIAEQYGKATKCTKNPGHKAKRFEWANISGKYLRDITDYVQLCPSCHRIMDNKLNPPNYDHTRKTHCKHGHPFTQESTYIDPRGFRNCKICRKNFAERRKENAIN